MRLIVAPMHRLPVVTGILVIDGGAGAERNGREGVSDIAAHALAEGTRAKSADELVMALERLGTSISASADWESTILKLTVLSFNLERALLLMSEMVTAPAFEEQAIERLRAERLSEIIQTRSEPRVLADELFSAALYDHASRYATPVSGSEASVKAITLEDVRLYHEEIYTPSAATLILAGDVSEVAAQQIAQKAFGGWTASPSNSGASARVTDRAIGQKQIHVVTRPGAQQSELRMGHVGVPRSLPEYFAVVVMNAVLGGLFSSRINLNLREVHGYTYGASSYFDWRRKKGPFVISSAVQSEATGAAIREVLNEVERIQASEISEDELTLATSYLAGVFPIRYETSEAVASGLASLTVFGLPNDYFTSYRSEILGVTTKEVQHAAKTFLHPSELCIVVVGNPEIVAPQLSALGLGAVAVSAETGL
jgi:zinc protease